MLNCPMTLRLILFVLGLAATTAFAEIEVLPGSSPQRALVRDVLPNPVRLRVLDAGVPVANARVTFYSQAASLSYGGVASRDGSECRIGDLTQICEALTNNEGIAQFVTLTSHFARTNTVNFRATDLAGSRLFGDVDLTFQFDPRAAPLQLAVASGGGQQVLMGSIAPMPIRITLNTADGRPVVGKYIQMDPRSYSIDWLGFDAGAPAVFTDAFGMATLPSLFAGWGVGRHELRVYLFDQDAGAIVSISTDVTVVNERGVPDVDLTSMWWAGPLENGWGMSVVKHGAQLFNVLFVYDDAGLPTWYVQPGGTWSQGVGTSFYGRLYSPRSAPWFAYDSSQLVAGQSVGEASLAFRGPERSSLSGDIRPNLRVDKELERQDFTGDRASPLAGVADMWWGGPQQNGWGIAIHEQFGNLFLVWFTYGADGKPTWFAMPGGEWVTPTAYSGAIYRTVGTSWVVGPYDASKLQVQAVGRYTVRFSDTGHAAFDYSVDGRSGTLSIQRQPFD